MSSRMGRKSKVWSLKDKTHHTKRWQRTLSFTMLLPLKNVFPIHSLTSCGGISFSPNTRCILFESWHHAAARYNETNQLHTCTRLAAWRMAFLDPGRLSTKSW